MRGNERERGLGEREGMRESGRESERLGRVRGNERERAAWEGVMERERVRGLGE